mmetsp:Transcript_21/g.43  ORF Transcript_21/g.43 Transcript_21/m.43 type:complete len:331 (+) Transcript_21:135-1127(+)
MPIISPVASFALLLWPAFVLGLDDRDGWHSTNRLGTDVRRGLSKGSKQQAPQPFQAHGGKASKKSKSSRGKVGECFYTELRGENVVPQGIAKTKTNDPFNELDQDGEGAVFLFDERCKFSDSRNEVTTDAFGYAEFCVVTFGDNPKKFIRFTLEVEDPGWPNEKSVGIFGTNGCHIHCGCEGSDGGRVTILAGDYFPRKLVAESTVPIQVPRDPGDPIDPTCKYTANDTTMSCDPVNCKNVSPNTMLPVDPIGLHGHVFLSGYLDDQNIESQTPCAEKGTIEEFIESMRRGEPYVSVSSDSHNYSMVRGNIKPDYYEEGTCEMQTGERSF